MEQQLNRKQIKQIGRIKQLHRRLRSCREAIDALAKQAEQLDNLGIRFHRHTSKLYALLSKHSRLCAALSLIISDRNTQNECAGLDALPSLLQIAILASLPLQKVVQLRVVCRSWNSLLRSPAFIDVHQSLQATDVWMVMSSKCVSCALFKQILAYSTSQHKLFPMPLQHPHIVASLGHRASLVLSDGNNNPLLCLFEALSNRPLVCASGAGGLLCCLVYDSSPAASAGCGLRSVLVFNPLTGAARRLPSVPALSSPEYHSKFSAEELSIHTGELDPRPSVSCEQRQITVAELSIHPHSGSHYYVVIRLHSRDTSRSIFDSMSGSWTLSPSMEEAEYGTLSCLTEGDLFDWKSTYFYDDGHLYFYSLRRGLWSKLILSQSCEWITNPCLERAHVKRYISYSTILKCDDRILLAAPLVSSDTFSGFAVWNLHTGTSLKVEATLLSFTPRDNTFQRPRQIVFSWDPRSLDYFEDYEVTFTTNGTHICMAGDDHMVYDIANDRWYRPPPMDDGSFDYIGRSCFQPRLDADPSPPVITDDL